ncbi:hypothetical protein [Gloeobacter violaceus]|uniref:hypothetical protein n=1 Tax=Gloeobacter violaceus TaxID=33072 RepID=UPI0013E8EAD2|nr:hypothetical protein [Gloeobacter violaceus]
MEITEAGKKPDIRLIKEESCSAGFWPLLPEVAGSGLRSGAGSRLWRWSYRVGVSAQTQTSTQWTVFSEAKDLKPRTPAGGSTAAATAAAAIEVQCESRPGIFDERRYALILLVRLQPQERLARDVSGFGRSLAQQSGASFGGWLHASRIVRLQGYIARLLSHGSCS